MIEQLLQIVAVSISQMALIFLKHVTVRVIVAQQVKKAMFFTLLMQLAWLISSALGINALLEHNYTIVAVYLASGVVGTWLNFKIKV
ncbi:MAG: hypothetical protein NTW78_05870 [Campylobacterales bacterium]|nr:hypothetical protein [Campylobacterales bacterium]